MAGSSSGGGSRIITTINTFAPNATLQEFDDFISFSSNSGGNNAKLAWNGLSTTLTVIDGTSDHPGIVRSPGRANAGVSGIVLNEIGDNTLESIALGGGVTSISWVARINTLSAGGNTYRQTIGMADATTLYNLTGDSYVNAVFFSYTDTVNSGKWVVNCTAASVTTSVNTTVAADTNFHTFSIIANATASSVSFYIDGSLVGTAITTNIPTVAILPFINQVRTAGTTSTVDVDLFWITINLTNARAGLPASNTILGTGMLIEQYVQTGVSYQVLNTDAIIGVSSTAAPRTITMPASSLVTGQRWTIKDESGGAAANNITVSGNGKNIDGAATYVINTNFGAVDIYYSGSNFFIV